jgi:hypothetical protein
MDKYNIESSSSFFLAEALEHGFTMADAALGGKRGGGGAHRRGKDDDGACWVVRMRWLKEELLGSSRRKRASAARRGSGWVPERALGHGDTQGSRRRCR